MNPTKSFLSLLSTIIMSLVLSASSGSTARVQTRDVQVQGRDVPVTQYSLGEINVSSDVGSFDSSSERKNYEASMQAILQNANLFGADDTKTYSLNVNIVDFDIPFGTFGGFDSTLDVEYELIDAEGKVVFKEVVQSGGSDDTGATLGVTRQNRSRTIAVAQNIESFVRLAERRLEANAKASLASLNKPAPAVAAVPAPITAAQLADAQLAPIAVDGSINFGSYYALIIGNNDYVHIDRLFSAIADAEKLANILQDKYGFQTRVLRNATRDDILSSLTEYRRLLKSNDNLLIYYAGHGSVDSQADEGYWLPIDAQIGDPSRWLSNADLTTSIRAMKAKHVLVVADSCFSGKLTRSVNVNINEQDYLTRLVSKQSRTVMTSGGLEPVVDGGGKDGHSVFASAFFDVLTENDGVADMTQMFNVIRRKVALNADQFPEYGDIRLAGHDGGDFLFVRAASPSASSIPSTSSTQSTP